MALPLSVRLQSLGSSASPCFLMHVQSLVILLDCGVDLPSLLNYLPRALSHGSVFENNIRNWEDGEQKVKSTEDALHGHQSVKKISDMAFLDGQWTIKSVNLGHVQPSELDCVLISNAFSLLGLPFLMRDPEFSALVLATEPCIQFGGQLMSEMVEGMSRGGLSLGDLDLHPLLLKTAKFPTDTTVTEIKTWQYMYTQAEVDACLRRIQKVSFNEQVSVHGLAVMTAVSSGYAIGSCTWKMQIASEQLVYLAKTSMHEDRFVSPVQYEDLKECALMIVGDRCAAPVDDSLVVDAQSPTKPKPSAVPYQQLRVIQDRVLATIAGGGSVLFPVLACNSTVYELIAYICESLGNTVHKSTPVYFLSPSASASLAFSNIYGEWLHKPQRDRMFDLLPPLVHATLIQQKRLQVFPEASCPAFRAQFTGAPCVVLCDHPTLRFGDAIHFMDIWSSDPRNLIIFTEPDIPMIPALAPFQPLSMRAIECFVDFGLTRQDAHFLANHLRPRIIVVPEILTKGEHNLKVNKMKVYGYHSENPANFMKFDLSLPFVAAQLDASLARQLFPIDVGSGKMITPITAAITMKDNCCRVQALSSTQQNVLERTRKRRLVGNITAEEIIRALLVAGLQPVAHATDEDGIVRIEMEGCTLDIGVSTTHIQSSDRSKRQKTLQALAKLLTEF